MKKHLFWAVAALALTACSADDRTTPAADNVIRLSTAIGSTSRAASNLLEGNFTDQQIMVQVIDLDGDDNRLPAGEWSYGPVVYTANGNGGLTTETPQDYPANGHAVDIFAYYPATAPTEAGAFQVRVDQSGDEAYLASDLMYASLSAVSRTSSAAERTLNFRHLLSKLVVTLMQGDMPDDDFNSATVALENVVIKGTFTPATGQFRPTSSSSDGSHRGNIVIARNAGSDAHAAIVLPQAVSTQAGRLAVTIGGKTLYYSFDEGFTFQSGQVYQLTVKVDRVRLSVTATMQPWNNVNRSLNFTETITD